ncbi:MAG: hypothetical protein HGA31_03060 [Candidatus Moranbacteria bacterium]|nr:hypothetical protein [Candidatus Moranbacteria bacterium]
MNRKMLFGIIAIIIFDRLFASRADKKSVSVPSEENGMEAGKKIPFLSFNEQYQGPRLPGMKHNPTRVSSGGKKS